MNIDRKKEDISRHLSREFQFLGSIILYENMHSGIFSEDLFISDEILVASRRLGRRWVKRRR